MGIFGKSLPVLRSTAGIIGTLLMAVSCFLSIQIAFDYFFFNNLIDGTYKPVVAFSYHWLNFGSGISINIGALVDPITSMMLIVVTFISLMVHIFSLGYMHGDERFPTYYAFLGLFTFSLLGLVMSSNIF